MQNNGNEDKPLERRLLPNDYRLTIEELEELVLQHPSEAYSQKELVGLYGRYLGQRVYWAALLAGRTLAGMKEVLLRIRRSEILDEGNFFSICNRTVRNVKLAMEDYLIYKTGYLHLV